MNSVETTREYSRKTPTALRLGVRAHDFGRRPAEELAARIAAGGFSCVQLALNKAIAGLELRAGSLNTERARAIGGAFARHGVGIEVLGCYINPIHPEAHTRAALLELFKDHLRLARDFGCRLVALESGSMNADYSAHPANHGEAAFQTLLASISELVAVAEQADVLVGLEAVASHTVSTAHKMRRVLDETGSDHLRVVFDPVNLLSAENFREQSRVMTEALELFGDRVAVIHAKDFVFENGALQAVPAGRGQLEYAPVLRFVRQHPPGLSLLLEGADENVAGGCAGYLRQEFDELNL